MNRPCAKLLKSSAGQTSFKDREPFGESEFPTLFQQEYDYSLDLWSFGCMFASMVCISVLIDDSA